MEINIKMPRHLKLHTHMLNCGSRTVSLDFVYGFRDSWIITVLNLSCLCGLCKRTAF